MVNRAWSRSFVFSALLVCAVTLTVASVVYRDVVVPKAWRRWGRGPRDSGGALRLEVNKTVFHAGEDIVLRCLFSNTTDRALYLQTKRPHSFLAGAFLEVDYYHNGELYAPSGMATGNIDASFYSAVPPHTEILLFRTTAVAGHALGTRAEWFQTANTEILPLPFSCRCEYRLEATYWDRRPRHRKSERGSLTDKASIMIMRDETRNIDRTGK